MLSLDRKCIIMDMQATTKEEVVRELVTVVRHRCPHIDPALLEQTLIERELVGSTGIGKGIAIPHGKIGDLDELLICFGRSRKGVNYDAVDNQPVYLFVQILSPLSQAREYLNTLAQVSRLLQKRENRTALLQARQPDEVMAIFATAM